MDGRIIVKKLEIIKGRASVQRWQIPNWEIRIAEHIAPGEYKYEGGWKKFTGNGVWDVGKTVFFRAKVKVPAIQSLKSLYLVFDCEKFDGLLTIDGKPYSGVDDNHRRVRVPHGGMLNLEAEFTSVPWGLATAHMRNEFGKMREIRFEQFDLDSEEALFDIKFAYEAGKAVRDVRRRQLINDAVDEALLAVDLTLPDATFKKELMNARKILRDRVGKIALDPEGGKVFLTGHSHIDTAWLWTVRETIRKCSRTFSTACRLMEIFPNYHFSCSQPQLYAYTKKYYPKIYDDIKRKVKEGRWETTGGMWVEADCNVTSGESLIRQILYGIKLFQEDFGTRPRTCWLPDVFGYPGTLPGILAGCGIKYFYTNKLHWQSRNPFPYHLFHWEGINGSRVLAHIPLHRDFYSGSVSPEDLLLSWDNYIQKAEYPEFIYPFGFGDGGGGPTEDHLRNAERAKNFPGVPACRQGCQEKYFDDVEKSKVNLPSWRGELYLETHRGTYTTHGDIKRANRKNELALRDAEIAGFMTMQNGIKTNLASLKDAWKNLLLLQFHDILPGSSISEVYEEAMADHKKINTTALSTRDFALDSIAKQVPADIVVFNTLSWMRNDVATAITKSFTGDVELVDGKGKKTSVQVIGKKNGGTEIVFAPTDVSPLGYTALKMRPAGSKPLSSLKVTSKAMENQFLRLELNNAGEITRLYDKRYDREIIAEGQTANQFQLFQDGPEYEAAWNIHATFEKRRYNVEGKTTLEVIENGPVRGIIRMVKQHRKSRFEQDIVMYENSPRIDFVTKAEWQERQVMLKIAFPVEIMADNATYEIQFGALQRTTHKNTSWDREKFEVAAHRWIDISENGYGVSLLNNCKYGHDVKGNVLRITALRGTEFPDSDADKGHHEFTYSLLPHKGDWREGETVRRAYELNVPLIFRQGGASKGEYPAEYSFLKIQGPAILETLKPAEDGKGIILRVYEPNGGRGKVTVMLSKILRNLKECNLVEEDKGILGFDGNSFSFNVSPFEIRTFRMTF